MRGIFSVLLALVFLWGLMIVVLPYAENGNIVESGSYRIELSDPSVSYSKERMAFKTPGKIQRSVSKTNSATGFEWVDKEVYLKPEKGDFEYLQYRAKTEEVNEMEIKYTIEVLSKGEAFAGQVTDYPVFVLVGLWIILAFSGIVFWGRVRFWLLVFFLFLSNPVSLFGWWLYNLYFAIPGATFGADYYFLLTGGVFAFTAWPLICILAYNKVGGKKEIVDFN